LGALVASPIVDNAHVVDKEHVVHPSTGYAGPAVAPYQHLWECAPQGIFVVRVLDDDGIVFVDANPAYRSQVTAGEVEFAGKPPSDILPPDMAQALSQKCRECLATGVPLHYEDSAGPRMGRRWRATLAPVSAPGSGAASMVMGQLWDLGSNSDEGDADSDSQRLLERVIDTSPDVIYVFDVANGRSAFLSSRVREVLGYEREYLQSLNIAGLFKLIHPQDLSVVKQHMARVRGLRDGAVASVEYRCRTRDGSYRWFRAKETAFSRAKDGSVEKLVGILSDIDQLKKARIAFTDMNAKLKAILASISDCYLTLDNECRVTSLNGAAARWLGKGADEMVGKSYHHLFAGSAARTAVKKASRDRRVVHVELPSRLHPGRWIDLRVYPSEEGVNIFFSDITKRRLAEEAAARSKAVLNASIDSLSAHIVILDAAGTIVASNKAWRRFAAGQWRARMASGPGFLALYEQMGDDSADTPLIAARVRSLLAGRRSSLRHIFQLSFGNQVRWYQLVAARFLHEGKAFAVVATEDVTEVRETNRALGELSERLLTLQEDERQRIAAELHDSTAQHLAAIGLNAMNLKARSSSDADTQKLWEDVEVSLEEATRELRAFTYLLHPMRLERDGLEATLQRYVEGFAQRTGLAVTVSMSAGVDHLPIEIRRSMLRIVQEALANVHRHASASRVSIKQKFVADCVHLIIQDDGIGMKASTELLGPTGGAPLGVGIQGMRERLRQFGGRLEIKSGSRGTTVHVIVPSAQNQRNTTCA
jgi:PAS domain S-box-containing protein